MTCWAEELCDCQGGLSREHYITQGIFDGQMIFAIGMGWCKEVKQISVASSVAKILCRRHNSLLAEFDSEAISLSRFLLDRFKEKPEDSGEIRIHGHNIEKWALKTSINLCKAGAIKDAANIPNLELLEYIFCNGEISEGIGLYLIDTYIDTRDAKIGVLWQDFRDTSTNELVGIQLTLHGLNFFVCLVPIRADTKEFYKGELSYRPDRIKIVGVKNTHQISRIAFDWDCKS